MCECEMGGWGGFGYSGMCVERGIWTRQWVKRKAGIKKYTDLDWRLPWNGLQLQQPHGAGGLFYRAHDHVVQRLLASARPRGGSGWGTKRTGWRGS